MLQWTSRIDWSIAITLLPITMTARKVVIDTNISGKILRAEAQVMLPYRQLLMKEEVFGPVFTIILIRVPFRIAKSYPFVDVSYFHERLIGPAN